MKNFKKYIFTLLASLVIMGTFFSANTIDGKCFEGNADAENSAGGTKTASGAASAGRSFWVLWLSDETGQPTLGSKVVTFAYQQVPPPSSNIITRFGNQSTVLKVGCPWNFPCWSGSGQTSSGNGAKLKGWLMQEESSGNVRAFGIITKYLGVDETAFLEALGDDKKDLYLNFQSGMFCNNFTTFSVTSANGVLCGTSNGLAGQMTAKNFVSRYSRNVVHRCVHYQIGEDWLGLSTNLDLTERQLSDNEFDTASKNSYGIGSIHLKQSYQKVYCVETPEGWSTFYMGTGNPAEIPDTYMGCSYVESTFSKKKTKLTDPEAPYSTVVGSGEPTRPGGTGSQKFDATKEEKAIFVHYKGEPEEPVTSEALIYEWETDYIMPTTYIASREEESPADNPFNLYTHIKEKIDEVLAKTEQCNKNSEYCPTHQQATCKAYIDKLTICSIINETDGITDLTGEQKEAKKWSVKLDANDGFEKAAWNLYKEETSGTRGEEWDTHKEAINKTDKWKVDQDLNARYAYILTRSQLENLRVAESRPEEGSGYTVEINTSGQYDWETGHMESEGGVAQKFDTGSVKDVPAYDYVYTCQGYNLYIRYYFKHDALGDGKHGSHEEKATVDGKETTVTVDEYCADHGYPSSHPENYQGHGGKIHHTFTENEWTAVTGSCGAQAEEKYKAGPTMVGRSSAAGTVVDSLPGPINLSGKFAKGSNFNYDTMTAQLVGSEFQGTTFKIVPEVLMTVWENEDPEIFKGGVEKPVYVMGEFERTTVPSIAHSYIFSVEGGSMSGIGSLASAATGSVASTVPSFDLGVTAMGTTFSVSTDKKYILDVYTIGTNADFRNNAGANGEWGNDQTDVRGSHEEYLGSILSGLDQEIIMELKSPSSNTSKNQTQVYYKLLTNSSINTRQDDNQIIDLWFDNDGLCEGSDGVDSCCSQMWYDGGTARYGAYQLDKILSDMFESYNDAQNTSRQYDPNPYYKTANGGKLVGHGAHWYDEESQYKQQTEYYHTRITFSLCDATDKLDYGVLQQNYNLSGEKDYLEVKFYTRIFNEVGETAADGFTWPTTDSGTFRIDEIKGTKFSIVNQTTAQMKK